MGASGGVELRGQTLRPIASDLNGPPVQLKHWPRDGSLEGNIYQEVDKICLQEFGVQEYVSNYLFSPIF